MKTRSALYALRKMPDVWKTTPSGNRGQSLGARGRAVQSPFSGHVPRLTPALAFLAVLVFTAGCGTACRCCHSGTTALASAPEGVEIDGREYTLTANAWRDFQPVAPPNGQPLITTVKVSAADGMAASADLSVDRVWVLNGKEQWSAAPEPGTIGLETAVRNGPKWGPGIKVNVVARLKRGKQSWLVRQGGVGIKRTD
jgi:hypothetical protein